MPKSGNSRDSEILPAVLKSVKIKLSVANISASYVDLRAFSKAAAAILPSSPAGISASVSETNTFIFAPSKRLFKSFTASAAPKSFKAYLAISKSVSGDVKTEPSEKGTMHHLLRRKTFIIFRRHILRWSSMTACMTKASITGET